MSNKTISINPVLFSVGNSKTKKREKKKRTNIVPLISPNVLKNKLLKRIKEHKQKELQSLDIDKQKIKNTTPLVNNKIKNNTDEFTHEFTDEFTDSLNYLQTLSKQKINDLEKQKKKEELERKTIKNYNSLDNPVINIDLPEELEQPTINILQTEPVTINYNKTNDVPYGILKGGQKPSYREWSKTIKNNIVTNPNSSLIIKDGGLNSENIARENRLNLLKQKLKNKNEELKADPIISEILIKKPIINEKIINDNLSQSQDPTYSQEVTHNQELNYSQEVTHDQKINHSQEPNYNPDGGKLIATKHITKKTIKKKYTLGKSELKNTIGVLIKDRNTRKKILTAQKELKRKNINEIKTYLREHNLIKIGSNAPNDVLRNLYESSMLTGEVTNINIDTLLHNFSKEDKTL
jgi:hypothetical protein